MDKRSGSIARCTRALGPTAKTFTRLFPIPGSLVEGDGHCGARLRGGTLQDWYAPNPAGDLRSGLGSWSVDDIVAYLKTGRNARTAAYGPMSEVITFSTSRLNDDDLKAIAAYLKDIPAGASDNKPNQVDAKAIQTGRAVYMDNCSACHRSNGEGLPGMFPPLKGDATVQDVTRQPRYA